MEAIAYLEIFTSCTGLKIIEESDIPSWICKKCEKNLLGFYKFRLKCIESDVLLTSIYVTAESKFEPKEDTINSETLEEEYDNNNTELDDIQNDFEEICDDLQSISTADPPLNEEIPIDEEIETPELIKTKNVPKKTRSCEICGEMVSAILTKYAIHVKSHNPDDPNPFRCKICDKKFKNVRCLKHHEHVHNNNKKSKCGYCTETFFHNSSKLLHERRIHTKLQPYKCSGGCENRSFFSKSELNLHNKRHHTPIKPFECTICLRKFSVKKDLRMHVVIHSEERHFQCDICGKGFSRETTLSLHKKAHTIDLAHPCQLCNLKFPKKHFLWKHIRENHQFDHTCEFCCRKFATADNLRKHKTVHAVKKKYSCPVCPLKKFCENHQLRRHIRDSHPGVELPPPINPKDRNRIKDNSIYYADEENEENDNLMVSRDREKDI